MITIDINVIINSIVITHDKIVNDKNKFSKANYDMMIILISVMTITYYNCNDACMFSRVCIRSYAFLRMSCMPDCKVFFLRGEY